MTTCLGKSCSFGLPRVPFVNCCQFMYLVISLLVLRAGWGIWLYQFLIIAYLFTLLLKKRYYTTRFINFILNDHSCKILTVNFPGGQLKMFCYFPVLQCHLDWLSSLQTTVVCKQNNRTSNVIITSVVSSRRPISEKRFQLTYPRPLDSHLTFWTGRNIFNGDESVC